jgi:outer membrane cobalamin receptor
VTILTREEILASGARDLADLLVHVPGFQLGTDVEGQISVGFRGVWGNEGKVLFLLDGVEMNDISYGTFPLGHHVLVDQIEEVEIIRGPGSVLYGGHAELAVVSVTTRAATVRGVSASAGAGTMKDAFSALYGTVAAGMARGDLSVGVAAELGAANRSDADYTDIYGDSFSMADSSSVDPARVHLAANWRGLAVRLLYDDYRTVMRDGYDAVAPVDVAVRWRTAAADAEWEFKLGERLSITPRVTYRRELPWQATDPNPPFDTYYYDVTGERLTGRVVVAADPVPSTSILGGVEAWTERVVVNDPSNGLLSFPDGDRVDYQNLAAFAEAAVDTRIANVLAGVRYEHHSEFGSSFVPRLALTKLFAPFHLKLLASGAFRAPSVENINYGIDVTPERTWSFEAEFGWQATRALYVAANAFDITIEDPIVFFYDEATVTEGYRNEGRTGSRGLELELRASLPFGSLHAGYSFYTASGKNRVATYEIPGRGDDLLLGFAGHKLTASAQLRPTRNLVVTPSLVFLSERYAHVDAAIYPETTRIDPRFYLDLFAAWRDLGVRGLELGAGVRNLLDESVEYVQPYDGGHAPLPGLTREFFVRLRYDQAG